KKNEFRTVIKHLHMKEIKAELDNVHSTFAPFATVYNWVNEFKRGRTFTCDAPRSGRPIKAATSEIIDKVHDIVLTDRRKEATGISHGTVISILHKQLGMKKLSARWVPRLLTMFQCNPDEFLRQFITMDETSNDQWRYYAALLDRLKKKRPHLAKKVLFHQDNSRPHPAYSPDILITETEVYFEGLDKSYYSDDLKYIKYIELKGDYVEK
ncbi:GVQW3 protein, partial [Acromyrmex heyeri]